MPCKMKTLFALTFLFCISVATRLKCYKCSSSDSMTACDKAKTEVTCPSSLSDPRCIKQSYKYKAEILKVESYKKGCTSKAICDAGAQLKVCEAADGDCKLDCCDGDLCNGGGSGSGAGGTAIGLKCYKCFSIDSMTACDKARTEVTCPSSLSDPRCIEESKKYTADSIKVESYSKGCASKRYCDAAVTLETCEAGDANCKTDCCDKDLCNDGSGGGGGGAGGAATGLKCYDCHSNDSMTACDNARTEVTCPSSLSDPLCIKESYTADSIEGGWYSKGCTSKATCDAAATWKKCVAAHGNCKMDCCDEVLCNGGAVPVVSVLLMVACALVFLYR